MAAAGLSRLARRGRPAEGPERPRRSSLRLALVGGALLLAAATIAVAAWPRGVNRGRVPYPALPTPVAAPTPSTVPAAPATAPSSSGPPPVTWPAPEVTTAVVPQRLVVPALGVDATVITERVAAGGALGVPDDPSTVGWWAAGPEPGAATGTAVLDGHVDTAAQGPGALFHLENLTPGQQLAVVGATGSRVFTVDAVREVAKANLASSGAFDQAVGARLVIVTCGGAFNSSTHTYADNVVVYATPAS